MGDVVGTKCVLDKEFRVELSEAPEVGGFVLVSNPKATSLYPELGRLQVRRILFADHDALDDLPFFTCHRRPIPSLFQSMPYEKAHGKISRDEVVTIHVLLRRRRTMRVMARLASCSQLFRSAPLTWMSGDPSRWQLHDHFDPRHSKQRAATSEHD